MRQLFNTSRQGLISFMHRLDALSPLAVLSRGYSLSMLLNDGSVVKDSVQIKPGDKIKTILSEGAFVSSVEEVINGQRKTVV